MYNKVIDALLANSEVLKATHYISPKLIIRAVRKSYKVYNRKPRKYDNIEIILTIGKPNYAEREFIKLCQDTKEPFPVKKVQLKMNNYKKHAVKKGKK